MITKNEISYKFTQIHLIRFSYEMNFRSFSICIVILVGFFHSTNASHLQTSTTAKIKFLKDDELCEKQIALLVAGYQRKDSWALRIWDAWGKTQSGIISGNLVNFGHYEQCLAVRHDFEDENFGTFLGQHCMIFFNFVDNVTIESSDETIDLMFPNRLQIDIFKEFDGLRRNLLGSSLCLPSFCRGEKVRQFADSMLSKNGMKTNDDYDQEEFCNIINILDIRSIDLLAS